MSLFTKANNFLLSLKQSFNTIKDKANYYIQNKNIVHSVLYANLGFIVIFVVMIVFLKQQKIHHYFDIRESMGQIKEISEGYELEFTKSQATLQPNIQKIKSIIKNVQKERDNIIQSIENINNDTDYINSIKNYVTMLNKRLSIYIKIIDKYSELVKTYKDYFIIAQNAENEIADNIELQLKLKHLMLDLEKIRLMSKNTNREIIINDIYEVRNTLIYESPMIQEKAGLFLDVAEKIVKSLRYLDTMRHSMDNDGYYASMQQIRSLTLEAIKAEEFNFSVKLIFFLLLSIIMVIIQFIVLTLFFINKKRTEKLQKEATDKIQKSQEIADRAKQYALDAQQSQYQLLHNFCSDFDIIVSNISGLSETLKTQIKDCTLQKIDTAFIDTQNVSISRLNASVIALAKWLNNYLEVYTPKDEWQPPQEDTLNITDLFDNNFAEARFFMPDKQHLLCIYHDMNNMDIISDRKYLFKLFINMVYVSIKWAENTNLKASITLKNYNIENQQLALVISVTNTASQEKYHENTYLFQKESETPEENTDETKETNSDRFVIAAIYYMKQICDMLSADFCFERTIMDENVLTAQIPVKLSKNTQDNVGVPLLQNKNVLVVSPYPTILRNMTEQLEQFGLNVTSLSDKYSAIGHIVGKDNHDKLYNLFIIEHNPPDIDAESLTKIIRENSNKNFVHIIITTTEEYLSQIEHNKSMYDAVFVKPVMPQLLKEKLEEFIEIQLYGANVGKNTADKDFGLSAESPDHNLKRYRFLAIMDEDLSGMLIQMVLTKVNYHVDVVANPTQLYELLEENYYNFILTSNKCSWVFPENLSRDIRRHHSDNKESVIIMIYDTLKDSMHQKLVRSGYDDFIQLPFSRSVFMDTIESWHDPIKKRMGIEDDVPSSAEASEVTEDNQNETTENDINIDTDNNGFNNKTMN